MLSFTGCGNLNSPPVLQAPNQTPNPTASEWTWQSGANIVNQPDVYGVQGTAASGNTPGARHRAASWTDTAGDLWLFGGTESDETASLPNVRNDLWKYSGGQWTWMSGSNTANQPGVYGTQGAAAPGNMPGARFAAVAWTDTAGSLWLFGGTGVDSTGSAGYLNDLWKYAGGQWTWVGGATAWGAPGVYGTQGTASSGNIPGARSDAVAWTDAAGNFWLFGGAGIPSSAPGGFLNDLWRYAGGEWAWMSGSNGVNQPGTYGTLGTAAPGNVPGARIDAAGWTDTEGGLWMFGGQVGSVASAIAGSTPFYFDLSDVWRYSGGEWTWMAGPQDRNQAGTYGILGTPAPGNIPGARWAAASWTDTAGNFWLFGGLGDDSTGTQGELNDLWVYRP